MVWEYDAPTVVMLTNLVEKMKLKCSQYWPDSGTANYGNFEVTLVNETSQADFVIRDFKINYVSSLRSELKKISCYGNITSILK